MECHRRTPFFNTEDVQGFCGYFKQQSNEFTDIEMKVSPLGTFSFFGRDFIGHDRHIWGHSKGDFELYVPILLARCIYRHNKKISFVNIFLKLILKIFYFFKSCVLIFSFFLRGMECHLRSPFFFSFDVPASSEIFTLSPHDSLPI